MTNEIKPKGKLEELKHEIEDALSRKRLTTNVSVGKPECARRHTRISMKHVGEMLLGLETGVRGNLNQGSVSSHNIVLANFTRSRVTYRWGGLPVAVLKTRAKFEALMCTSAASCSTKMASAMCS